MPKTLVQAEEPLALEVRGDPGRGVVAWACRKCRVVCASEQDARECCAEWACACGKTVERKSSQMCPECEAQAWKAKLDASEKRAVDAAVKFPWQDDPEGPFFVGDEYYPDLCSVYDQHCNDDDPPRVAWFCEVQKLAFDAGEIVARALEADEHCEEACDAVSDVARLQAALDAWAATQSVETWFQDQTRAVVLDDRFWSSYGSD